MNIEKILNELTELVINPVYAKGSVNGISYNINSFHYVWNLTNEIDNMGDYNVKVDSIDDAIEIIHQFSQDSKDNISIGIQKDINKLEDGKDIYLNVSKIPSLIYYKG